TYQGTLDLSNAAPFVTVAIENGITLTGAGGTGPGAVLVTGYQSTLAFYGTQTVENAAISIGSPVFGNSDTLRVAGSGATLTLGTNLTIAENGTFANISAGGPGDTIDNAGT